jgi:hypothetical protein
MRSKRCRIWRLGEVLRYRTVDLVQIKWSLRFDKLTGSASNREVYSYPYVHQDIAVARTRRGNILECGPQDFLA